MAKKDGYEEEYDGIWKNDWRNDPTMLEIRGHEEAMDKDDEHWRNNDPELSKPRRKEQAFIMNALVLSGGFDVGMKTNPDLKNRPSFIEINGEKVVCLAQGGECRQSGQFYFPGGLNNPDSWKTPIISRGCDDRCPYKYLVCDGHDHSDDDSVKVFIPYPDYNKFRGEFERYCKDFSRIH